MKKAISINIAVISNLFFLYMLAKIDLEGLSIAPAFTCIIVTQRLCKILIPYEDRMTHKIRLTLFILIILSYINILGIYYLQLANIISIILYPIYLQIMIYLILIGVYFTALFDRNERKNDNPVEHQ